jgi:hypothetical protein
LFSSSPPPIVHSVGNFSLRGVLSGSVLSIIHSDANLPLREASSECCFAGPIMPLSQQ